MDLDLPSYSTTTEVPGFQTPNVTDSTARAYSLSSSSSSPSIPSPLAAEIPRYNHREAMTRRKRRAVLTQDADDTKRTRDDRFQVLRMAEEDSDSKLAAYRKARDEYFDSRSTSDVRGMEFLEADRTYREAQQRLIMDVTVDDAQDNMATVRF